MAAGSKWNCTASALAFLLFVGICITYLTFHSQQDTQYEVIEKIHSLKEEIKQLGNQLYQLNVDLEERVKRIEEEILFK